ncbi:hypothetical protein [Flavobacterium silvaticum]|uniref:Adhesin domain-containing protein n=1 Tax=Flavobacterium silvaticum TaxID=1852020 RepID=A0A972JJB1_9FLAO|nr:hypothetical protein [Flavobacterium silvaticum]NMH29173.1 hypothetical protein [Flavobacterium silvaticum]
MKLLFKILFIGVLVPQLLNANGDPGRYSKQKQIAKAFVVNPDAVTQIETKYGNIYVTTWNEDKIQLDISIKVSGDDEKWVTEKLNSIDVDIKALKNLVSAETKFGTTRVIKGTSWFEINYTLHVPTQGGLKLQQKFGNIILPDLSATTKIELEFGNFESGNLTGPTDLSLKYSDKAFIKSVRTCNLEAKYSKLTVESYDALKIDSGYSDIVAINGTNVKFNGNYGSISCENVEALAVDGNYLKINVGAMTGSCRIASDYSKIKISALKNDWGALAIDGNYSNSDIGFTPNRGFILQAEGNYSRFNLDDIPNIPAKKTGNHVSYNGSYKDGNAAIRVNGNYGSVKFHKL